MYYPSNSRYEEQNYKNQSDYSTKDHFYDINEGIR